MTEENKENKETVEETGCQPDEYASMMMKCLSDAYLICSSYNDVGESETFHCTEVALALFRKHTEGDERKELTALFERVAAWWMEREEKQTVDMEASRESFIATANAIAQPVPPADPVLQGLRSVVNCLLDIVEDAARAKAGDAGFAIGTAVKAEIKKQTGQEGEDNR